MLEAAVLVVAVMVLHRQLRAASTTAPQPAFVPKKVSPQLAQLTDYANRLFTEKKWLAAEKAYLNILKLDHKHLTAYTHLGVIYSAQRNLSDAIECFEMAARLRPGGNSLQNLGLAYLENRNYMKSVAAFEKAIMLEPTAPRYVGLSRAYRKLSNLPEAVKSLEKAVERDASKRNLHQLAEAYDDSKQTAQAQATWRRLHELDPGNVLAAGKVGVHLPAQPAADA